jgi:hypothetical protein
VKLKRAWQAMFYFHAAFQQAGRDLKSPGLRHRDAGDRAYEQLVIAGPLGVVERVAGAGERVADPALEEKHPTEESQDVGGAPMVLAYLLSRALAPSDNRRKVSLSDARERESDVRALRTGRRFGKQLVEDRTGSRAIPRQAVRFSCLEAPIATCGGLGGRGELGSNFIELGGGRRRSAPKRVWGGLVQCNRDARVWPLGREREVSCSLLGIGDGRREPGVCVSLPPRRCLAVTDGGHERMREPHSVLVDLENTGTDGLLQPLEHSGRVAVRGGQCLDRGACEGGGKQKGLAACDGQLGQPPADYLA